MSGDADDGSGESAESGSGAEGTDGGASCEAAAPDSGAAEPDSAPAEGYDSLLAALQVGRHARVGLAVGIGLAAAFYLPSFSALGGSLAGARGFYLGLAFVLAATTAAVVTAALSVKTFLDPVLDHAKWHRRGAMAAILGGLGWASTPALAALANAGAIGAGPWRTTTSFACVALLLGTIALHGTVKSVTAGPPERPRTVARVERAAYWLVVVGLLVAAANATGNAAPVTTTDDGALATPFLIGVLLASVGAIPLAAAAELTGRLPRWRIRALQGGALAGAIAIAWLVTLGGWDWLVGVDASAEPLALAVALVPAGLGWAIAGQGLWVAVARGRTGTPREDSASTTESTTELGDE